jgi:hypothetical protein
MSGIREKYKPEEGKIKPNVTVLSVNKLAYRILYLHVIPVI